MNRSSYADYLKGILMLTVLAAHTWHALSQGLQPTPGSVPLLYVMEPWHMPLFMAVAGWFFAGSVQKRSFEELAGNKCRTILIPLVLWTILYQLCLQILDATGAPTDTLSTGSLWFLYSLLLCSLLMALCYHAGRKTHSAVEYALALALVVWLSTTSAAAFHIAYMFPFFFFGYACARMRARPLPGWASCIILASTVLFYVFAAMNGHAAGWTVWVSGTWIFGPQGWRRHLFLNCYRISLGLAGSIGFAGVMYSLQKLFKNRKWNEQLAWYPVCIGWVKELGKWSLTVYAAQSIVVELLFSCGVSVLYDWNGGNPFAGHVLLLKWIIVPPATLVMAAATMMLVRKLQGSCWISRALTGK